GTIERPMPLFAAAPPIWTPLALRDVTLPNRIVLMQPATDAANDGMPGEGHADQLARRAQGGAGLVVTAPVAVSAEGRITPGCAGMYAPEHALAWAQIVEAIHKNTPAKIALQLSHAGRRGATRPRTRGIDRPLRVGAWPLLAPSA